MDGFVLLTSTPSCVVLGCALGIARRGETTHTGVDVNNTHPSMINPLNTFRPRQDVRHFSDAIYKYIFLKENVWIPIKISLKFVPKGPINNIPALVQIMAWRRPGDKSLYEPMMVCLLTHICVTRPQWVNTLSPRQDVRNFSDDIFKCIFLNENVWISIKISLKFFPKGSINNISALVQIDNGLAAIRRQAIIWTEDGLITDAYMCHSASMS